MVNIEEQSYRNTQLSVPCISEELAAECSIIDTNNL
jgi:hypothetical protein